MQGPRSSVIKALARRREASFRRHRLSFRKADILNVATGRRLAFRNPDSASNQLAGGRPAARACTATLNLRHSEIVYPSSYRYPARHLIPITDRPTYAATCRSNGTSVLAGARGPSAGPLRHRCLGAGAGKGSASRQVVSCRLQIPYQSQSQSCINWISISWTSMMASHSSTRSS